MEENKNKATEELDPEAAKKAEKQARKKERKAKGKGLLSEFKAFLNKGNAFMLAVGVVIGSAFSTIVTAMTNILLSVCTWGVPGGISGLVTVLPALNNAQEGIAGIGQSFANDDMSAMAKIYAESQGATYEGSEAAWITSLKTLYTQHGTTWTYNQSAVIDWGSFINAVIAFLVIGIVLFTLVKVMTGIQKKNEEIKAKNLERYYEKHPDERPVPPDPGKPAPTTEELLTQILAELKAENKKVKQE